MSVPASLRALVALVLLAPLLSACLEPDRTTIALMMSSTADESWDRVVWPRFKREVNSTCVGCEIETFDADGDSKAQAAQLRQALSDKVDVIVLDAVTSESGEQLVLDAGEVPVIAFNRFVPGADRAVVNLAGSPAAAAVQGVRADQRVAVVSGTSADDDLAASIVEAQQKLSEAGATLSELREVSPAALRGLDLVLAATAADVDEVSKAASALPPAQRPRVVTFSSDLTTLRQLIAGEVAQSVFVPEDRMAREAAAVAVALVTKEDPPPAEDFEGVPTVQFAAEPLRLSNLTTTLVKEGRYSLDELCEGDAVKRCQSLGLL